MLIWETKRLQILQTDGRLWKQWSIVQSMSKGPNIKRMTDLKTLLVKRCKGVLTYCKGCFMFDGYQAKSLTAKTWAKLTGHLNEAAFSVNDEMNELFARSK